MRKPQQPYSWVNYHSSKKRKAHDINSSGSLENELDGAYRCMADTRRRMLEVEQNVCAKYQRTAELLSNRYVPDASEFLSEFLNMQLKQHA